MNHGTVCIVVLFVFQVVGFADADEKNMVIKAEKDTVIYKESGSKSNGSGEFLFVGQNGGGSARRSLVKFDLAKIPANAMISKASVVLNVTKANKDGSQVALHRLMSAWGEGKSDAAGGEGGGAQALEGDTTWEQTKFPNQEWKKAGGDFNSGPSAKHALGKSGKVTWTSDQLTKDVQEWAKDKSTNFGWMLIGDESKPGTAARFNSRVDTDAGPQLLIEYSIKK